MQVYYLIIIIIPVILTGQVLAEENRPIELEPVVVTASKIEEPLSEVPASVEIITHQEIIGKQAVALGEVLQSDSGLNILTLGGVDPTSTTSIRGASYRQTIFMIDGIKINPPFEQTPETGSILLGNIDRIEVVKGSYSALYGADAIGGVINLITMERPGLAYSLSGGTYKTFNSGLFYSDRHNDTIYTLGYERFNTDGFRRSGPYYNNSLIGKINYPVDAFSSIQFTTYYWNWNKYERSFCCEVDGEGNLVYSIDKDSSIREDNWLNSLQLSHAPSVKWDYNIKFGLYNLDLNMDNPLNTPSADRPSPVGWKLDIGSFRDTFEMHHNFYYRERNTLTAGIQYTWERLRKEQRSNSGPDDKALSDMQPAIVEERIIRAVYLQDLYKIKEHLSITAGVRFENSPHIYDEWSPKIGALYTIPLTNTTLRASYGHGFRAPSLNELNHRVMGNPDLKPENSINYEAGFRQGLMDKRIYFDAAAFRMDFKRLIDWSSNTPPYKWTNVNGDIKGVEASLQGGITGYLDTTVEYTRLITQNYETDNPLSYRPDYKWTFDVIYRPIKRLILNINAIYTGRSFDPSRSLFTGFDGKPLDNTIEPYSVVNMAASFTMARKNPAYGSLDIFFKLNNIFDEEYVTMGDFQNYGLTFLAGIRSTY